MIGNIHGAQYRQFVFKPDDYSDDDTASVLLAFSTMAAPDNLDELCLLHKISPGSFVPASDTMNRMWLHDLLDNNYIPYLIESASVWVSRRKHGTIQSIYVKARDYKDAVKLKRTYRDAAHYEPIIGTLAPSVDGSSPQSLCNTCGMESDFDFIKCPHCKNHKYV